MRHRILGRMLALGTALALALAPAAGALTREQAGELLERYYLEEVPEEVLSQPTIRDMIDALGDPYTAYFTPEEYQAFNASMGDTELIGIGVSVSQTADGTLVERVYEGTPAQAGGLRAGDLITAVDGKTTVGVDLDTVGTWLRSSAAGTQVTVTYLRDGASHTVVLTRRQLVIPTTVVELAEGHIGLIECTTFGDQTLAHVTDGIIATAGAADRWVVDLRSNGGGWVDVAVNTVGLFTGPGVGAYLRDGTGRYGTYGIRDAALTDSPVIVLTDAATASASELFAAAIRDRGAGINVGTRTYGKGVAQSMFDQSLLPTYFPDGDAIKITAYRFFSADGNTTDTVGVIPHLLVPADAADEVARLLCAPTPAGDTSGILRLDLGGQWWYIDLDTALLEENRAAFTLLLEAIPVSARLQAGLGGPLGWQDVTPEEVAQASALVIADRGFTDTADSPFAREIDLLATYGIINGMGNGRFQPEQTLTRAQLCCLLYQALNYDLPIRESSFSDVPLDAWYGQEVNALAQLGMVGGMGDGTFCPDDPVTHEQFIAIMGRMARYLNMYLYDSSIKMPSSALDAAELAGYSDWARDEVWLLALSQRDAAGETINLLWAAAETIDPNAGTTREEAASLVYSLFSGTGILPA